MAAPNDAKSEASPWRLTPHCGKGNGFIYIGITWIMFLLNGINLMQGFKALATIAATKNGQLDRARYGRYACTAVDLYTVGKWAAVLLIWLSGANNGFVTFIVWYLVIANLHT